MCSLRVPIVVMGFLVLSAAVFACLQNQSAQRGNGSPPRELASNASKEKIPEEDLTQDGPRSISYSEIFKYGSTKWSSAPLRSLEKTPPLPTGYEAANGLAYKLETEVAASGFALTTFQVSSVKSKEAFDKLAILHLESDELSPFGAAWVDRTVLPSRWRDGYFGKISKESFSQSAPDFSSKRISAIHQGVGIFVLAEVNQTSQPADHPFTEIETETISSPKQAFVGDKISYNITVRNKGAEPAGDVNLQDNLDIDITFVSAVASQGQCRQSTQSDDKIICHLGALPVGANVSVTIIGQVRNNIAMDTGPRKRYNRTFVVFKANPADMANYVNTVRNEIFTVTTPRPN